MNDKIFECIMPVSEYQQRGTEVVTLSESDSLEWIETEHIYNVNLPDGMTEKEYFDSGKQIDKHTLLDFKSVTVDVVPVEIYDVQPINEPNGLIHTIRSNYGN